MTSVGIGLVQAMSIAAILLFVCSDAFQTPIVLPQPPTRSSQPAAVDRSHLQLRSQSHRGVSSWQSRPWRLLATVAPANAAATNATNKEDDLVDLDDTFMIPPEVFFPPPDAEGDEEPQPKQSLSSSTALPLAQSVSSSTPSKSESTTPSPSKPKPKSGGKRRAIARAITFPMRALVWKPLWKSLDNYLGYVGDYDADDGDRKEITSTSSSETSATTTTSSTETTSTPVAATASVETAAANPTPAKASTAENPAVPKPETPKATKKKDDPPAAAATSETPQGDRWAVAAPGVDLSGRWELIVTPEFKVEYDKYLEGLGQPKIVRTVALSGPVIGQTMEELIQIDQGKSLMIRGKNVRGTWDRTLVASGSTKEQADFEPLISPIRTVDQESVQAEAWWEDEGSTHVSWMRGVTMYGGGNFYARRYFEPKTNPNDETVYASYGFFEFDDPSKPKNELTWRFRRMKD